MIRPDISCAFAALHEVRAVRSMQPMVEKAETLWDLLLRKAP